MKKKSLKTSLEVVIKKVLFQDYNFEKDIYFTYMKGVDSDNNNIILKGYVIESPHSLIDININFFGDFTYDENKRVYVFEFDSYNIAAVEFKMFLKTIGFSKKIIEKIVEYYNYEEFIKILEKKEIEELTLIKGIGKKTAQKAIERFKYYRDIKILTENLSSFNFNTWDIHKIYNYYKEKDEFIDFDELCFKIIMNPYILLKIPGMDFHKIDEIAINQIGQIKSNSIIRIEEGIKYALRILREKKGSTIFNKKELFYQSYLVLETNKFTLDIDLFNQALMKNLEKKEIIEIENDYFILKDDLEEEEEIYSNMMYAIKNKIFYDFLLTEDEAIKEIEDFEKNENIRYSKEQKQALINILTSPSPVFFINGYAGTGKTTVIRGAIRILMRTNKINSNDIMVCALAGTAANRAKNVIGLPFSKTIHSMIGIIDNPKTGIPMLKYNEKMKLPYKIIVVDESAMIDNFLFKSLLNAVDFNKTKIIFVGDIAQLPPVGHGNPFESFVNSNITNSIKVSFLKIFRQKDGMLIPTANNIRQGKIDNFLNLDEVEYKDFYYKQFSGDKRIDIKESIESKIEKNIEIYLQNIKEKKYDSLISNFQTLSTKKEGLLGVYHLNRIIQRIIHKKNNYSLDNRFIFLYYIIDFLYSSEEKKYYFSIKLKTIINEIKKDGYKTYIEQKMLEEILKKIDSAIRRKIFYHLEKFLRKNVKYITNYYGYYFGERYIYKENDRIIHLKNKDYITFNLESYEDIKRYILQENIAKENLKKDNFLKDRIKIQRVYNGQIGIIDLIIPNLGIFVIYPYEGYVVVYNNLNYDIVNLAYSITVHKSQGQEYENVYIPILNEHLFMLNTKALYTAITRAKEKVFLFSQKHCVPKTIAKKNDKYNEYIFRDTFLRRILSN